MAAIHRNRFVGDAAQPQQIFDEQIVSFSPASVKRETEIGVIARVPGIVRDRPRATRGACNADDLAADISALPRNSVLP
jgi:hypothetical protein